MQEKKISDSLRQVAGNFDGLNSELLQVADMMDELDKYNLRSRMMSLERIAEINTIELRNLTARMGEADVDYLYGEIADVLGISVEEQEHWIKIVVPGILPKRNVRDNQMYLMRPLRHALVEFERKTPMERFGKCAICIVHTYDVALGETRVRDYDNIETKRYLDVIESFFLTADSGNACTVLQTTAMSDRDTTVFYIMLPQSLPGWIKKYVNGDTKNG